MRMLRRIFACCLLLALPAQLLAAFAPCCPADRGDAHTTAASHTHPGVPHADHAAPTALAHAGHPCDEAAAGTAGPRESCDAAQCAMHCAHALTLTELANVRSPLARVGTHFPAPLVRHDDVAALPHLRPPISVHC
jgi:hypothetical protein